MTLIIIIVTSLISIYAFFNRGLYEQLMFKPFAIRHHGQGWRFFTYGLVHADWIHLGVNMLVLYSFGSAVTQYFTHYFDEKGYLFYLLLYVGGIIFSVLVDFGKHKDNAYYSAVGASGAVSAVLFASILLHPSGKLMVFPLPFPIPSVAFGVIYLVYSAMKARRANDNIGHNAHFWGAVFGIAFTIALKPIFAVYFWQEVTSLF